MALDSHLPGSARERMLAGQPYRADDARLRAARAAAQRALAAFHACAPDDDAARSAVLRALCGRWGDGSVALPSLRLDYGSNLFVGARCFVNYDCVLLDANRIVLGDDVLLGPGVHLYTATHPLDAAQRASGVESALPIEIGDAAWLGGGVRVLPGVRIGAGTVVGAGSVVTRSLPARVLAFGNPCRVVRAL